MENTPTPVKKKAYTKPTAIIGMVACLLMAILFFTPWFTYSYFGGSVTLFNSLLNSYSSVYMILSIICIMLYAGAILLFVFDHPKLVLIPSIIGFVLYLVLFGAVGDAVGSTMYAELTAWPYIQMLLGILIIVMSAVTRKANPKYVKVKVQPQ